MQYPNVHYAGDGRGPRDVFVNENLITHVVYANQVKGVIKFAPHPLRVKRNGEIYIRKLRGEVQVIFTGGYASNDTQLPLFGERGLSEVSHGHS